MFDLKNLGFVFSVPTTGDSFPLPYCLYETIIYTQQCHLDLSQPKTLTIRLWGDLTLKGG